MQWTNKQTLNIRNAHCITLDQLKYLFDHTEMPQFVIMFNLVHQFGLIPSQNVRTTISAKCISSASVQSEAQLIFGEQKNVFTKETLTYLFFYRYIYAIFNGSDDSVFLWNGHIFFWIKVYIQWLRELNLL